MHAIRIHRHGGPEVLQLESAQLPPPGEGEVLVRHEAVGVNLIDTYHRAGVYPLPLPSGLGMEAAGVVEAVGPGVTTVQPGARVAYVANTPGSYATHRTVRADRLLELPHGLDAAVAAAALLKGMTVEFLVQRCSLAQPGQWAVVHAAAGGVGQLLCQWLLEHGVHVLAVVGSNERVATVRSLGTEHVLVDRGTEALGQFVRATTHGAMADVVFDSVGKATLRASMQCLRRRGLLVSYGNASGVPEPVDVLELSRNGSLFLTRPTLFDYVASREELQASAAAVFARLQDGRLRVRVHAELPLHEAARAHELLASRSADGSLVLRV